MGVVSLGSDEATGIPGDANLDGVVMVNELVVVILQWGTTCN